MFIIPQNVRRQAYFCMSMGNFPRGFRLAGDGEGLGARGQSETGTTSYKLRYVNILLKVRLIVVPYYCVTSCILLCDVVLF